MIINSELVLAAQKSVDGKQYKLVNNRHVPYINSIDYLTTITSTRRHVGEIGYVVNGSIIETWQFIGGIADINFVKVFPQPVSGGTTTRFGIEDNVGIQDRIMNLNTSFLDITSGTTNFSGQVSDLYIEPSSLIIFHQDVTTKKQSSIDVRDAASGLSYTDTTDPLNIIENKLFARKEDIQVISTLNANISASLSINPTTVQLKTNELFSRLFISNNESILSCGTTGNFSTWLEIKPTTARLIKYIGVGGAIAKNIVTSVNNILADDAGNITIATSGSTVSRFGIEDNVGVQNRVIDLQSKNFNLESIGKVFIGSGKEITSLNNQTLFVTDFQIDNNTIDIRVYKGAQDDYSNFYLYPNGLNLFSSRGNANGSLNNARSEFDIRPELISSSQIVNGIRSNIMFPFLDTFFRPATYLTVSVNGTFANASGNIVLPVGGASTRFGIEDSTGVQNRFIDLATFNLIINSGSDAIGAANSNFSITPGTGISLLHTATNSVITEVIVNSGSSILRAGNSGAGQTSQVVVSPSGITASLASGISRNLPLSVNGNFADAAGNITVATGGGTTPSLQAVTTVGNTTTLDIEITDATKGIILNSPAGGRWRVTVNNSGVLTTTAI